MSEESGSSQAAPLTPSESAALKAMDPLSRAEWMLEDCARHEEAWALEDADGWVVFCLAEAPEDASPWALPLWPRQELAALEAKDASEQVRRLPLAELLEGLLPELEQRGWQVLACPGGDGGASEAAGAFSRRLSEAWDELNEEEG